MGDDAQARLELSILGPLAVRVGPDLTDAGPHKQRVLLGVLLLRANRVVSVEHLLEAVWPEERPKTARKNLQVYVSALRKIVGDRIRHVSYGYVLDAGAQELDALRFEELTTAGYTAYHQGDLDESRQLLGQAVELWRGDVLADLVGNPVVAADADQLGQRLLAVYEDWVDMEIEAGRHLTVLNQLVRQSRRHPFRERLVAATITALHRAGRRREALATFEAHRQLVARELGVAPSLVLQRLYQNLLADGANPTTPAAGPAPTRIRPAQLPRDVPDFVGRAAQIDALVQTLTSPDGTDVAVVTGSVGTGKTALAVRAGHRMAGAFRDGEIFVSLREPDGRPRSVRDVATELLRATGLDIPTPHHPHEVSAVWRSWIADREFLIVLDDAVDEAQVQQLLPGSGRNRVLVTSAYRLSGLESVHRTVLDELTSDEVNELADRALGRRRSADAPLRRILRRAGGAPLVVRAVMARLDALRYVSISEYADRLETAPSVLRELPFGGAPVRDRVARVYAGLPETQQQVVRTLSVLPGGSACWSELIDALPSRLRPAVEVVDRLVEANVVRVPEVEVDTSAVRYTVPSLVRHFALDLDS